MKALLAALALVSLTACSTAAADQTTAARRTTKPSASTSRPSPTASSTRPAPGGIRTCTLDTLPAQAADTTRLVAAGGPFPYPRNDGVTYFNKSKALPAAATGTYREFTVKTPGASNRGTRRVITGGNPASGAPTKKPSVWYYTGDHYNTFCAITGL